MFDKEHLLTSVTGSDRCAISCAKLLRRNSEILFCRPFTDRPALCGCNQYCLKTQSLLVMYQYGLMISYVFLKVKRSCQFCDANDHFYSFFHGFHRNKFEIAVEIVTACEQIGAGQTHEGKTGAVCAAADRLDDRSDATIQHSLFCKVNDLHVRFDLRDHIIVLICQFQFNAVIMFCIFLVYDGLDQFFSVFKGSFVKVTDDIIQFGICGGGGLL